MSPPHDFSSRGLVLGIRCYGLQTSSVLCREKVMEYRGSSLIRNYAPLRPYSRFGGGIVDVNPGVREFRD